jgi:hypothetical protein
MISDLFTDAKFINIELLQYAMELIDKEDKKKQKILDKLMKKDSDISILNSLSNYGTLFNIGLLGFLLVLWFYYRDDIHQRLASFI